MSVIEPSEFMPGLFTQEGAAKLAQQTPPLPWLADQRDSALASWLDRPWPTRKTEDWKYTSLDVLAQGDYLRFCDANSEYLDIPSSLYTVEGLAANRLVFVNGHLAPELCSDAGMAVKADSGTSEATIVRFCNANDSQRMLIEKHLGSIANLESSPFTALNSGWLDDGVLLHVPKQTNATQPLHVVNITTPNTQAFSVRQRLLVVLETGSTATVIEHFVSTEEQQSSFVNGVTELQVSHGAQLNHYRLHLEEEHSIHIGGVYAQLQRDARLESFLLGLGSQLKRIDLRVQHQGPGSHCQLNGVYLPREHQHIDVHSTIEHEAPYGTTEEVFRGIIDDHATAVFNGRIHIHPHAQQTLAELSNKNLLLTNTATVNTKPELEIYADDVRCAHGATVSQIEDQALYYMESRGIDRKEAEVMLSFGFINELLNKLSLEPIQKLLRPVLTEWFGRDSALTRHIE
ncbi:MAG: Fe-S cluster assembly protein SufD [Pseudomonadales bacterium]